MANRLVVFAASPTRQLLPQRIGCTFQSLYCPIGKIQIFSYRLEFSCTNNVTEFEALLLGNENAYNFGCGHLTVFGDSKLVVNLVCKIYSPNNKLMKHYTQAIWIPI